MKLVNFAIYASLTILFVVVWIMQVSRSAWVTDEAAHISSGLYHIETGRMDAYRVNPPLPRIVAAFPLLFDRPKVEWQSSDSSYFRNEYQFAHEWVRDNAKTLPRYLLLTRSTVLLSFAIGLWSITRWAARLYGTSAACLAGAMWSFNPDIVAHSAVVAPDLPATAMGLLAGYRFWDWLARTERPFPWSVATVVGLAILCKFSWLILLPLLPLVTFVYDFLSRHRRVDCGGSVVQFSNNTGATIGGSVIHDEGRSRSCYRDAVRLTVSFSLTLLIINFCYGFEGTGKQLGEFKFISRRMAGSDFNPSGTGNRFESSLIGKIPVPLPREMLRGLDYLSWEFEKGMRCYLRGTWQHGGWWYFYLYAMAVKIPIGYWVLIVSGMLSLAFQVLMTGARFRLEWMPVLIATIFIVLISSQIGFTHHVRYVLPAYGFLFLVASRVMAILPARFGIGFAATCLSATVWFQATHLGMAHTFFNLAAGGPNNGWRHLSYSNVDWGQSTYRMVDWVKDHPDQRPMTVLFRPTLGNPHQLIAERNGIYFTMNGKPGCQYRPGWYLVSSFQLTREKSGCFWNKTPVAQPYADVLLFHVPGEPP